MCGAPNAKDRELERRRLYILGLKNDARPGDPRIVHLTNIYNGLSPAANVLDDEYACNVQLTAYVHDAIRAGMMVELKELYSFLVDRGIITSFDVQK